MKRVRLAPAIRVASGRQRGASGIGRVVAIKGCSSLVVVQQAFDQNNRWASAASGRISRVRPTPFRGHRQSDQYPPPGRRTPDSVRAPSGGVAAEQMEFRGQSAASGTAVASHATARSAPGYVFDRGDMGTEVMAVEVDPNAAQAAVDFAQLDQAGIGLDPQPDRRGRPALSNGRCQPVRS